MGTDLKELKARPHKAWGLKPQELLVVGWRAVGALAAWIGGCARTYRSPSFFLANPGLKTSSFYTLQSTSIISKQHNLRRKRQRRFTPKPRVAERTLGILCPTRPTPTGLHICRDLWNTVGVQPCNIMNPGCALRPWALCGRAFTPVLFLLCLSIGLLNGNQAQGAAIPDKAISELKQDLEEASESRSSTRKRLAYKRVVREGESLVQAAPEATNRWVVLEVMFRVQKQLFTLDDSRRNREALFEVSRRLSQAPDNYADLRLEADMLLMEGEMSGKNADVVERARGLAALVARYRGTPGEAKSLMMASLIAPKLDAFDLEKDIIRALDERFAGDHEVVVWRRKQHGYSHFRVLFTGGYKRADGTLLQFPSEGIGQTCLLSFWSEKNPGLIDHFGKIQDLQERFPGQTKVFSFNLDGLPDAGQSVLESNGLDWVPLQLPGGRDNPAYQVYGAGDPYAVRVNAHGHAFIPSTLVDQEVEGMPMEGDFDGLRYLAQIQSLVSGDFLASGLGEEDLAEIGECWVPAPFRYRLSPQEALANYRKAEQLCAKALQGTPDSQGLWRVRNLRILALLGMWKLEVEPKHLEAAVGEARAVLESNLPKGADIVPRFCLAKDALRRGGFREEQALLDFVAAFVSTDVPPRVYAAAAILAMDVNAKELHESYRAKFLASYKEEPPLWPVATFLRDPKHRYRMFKSNFYMPPSLARRIERANLRSNAADRHSTSGYHGKLDAGFLTLDGKTVRLPGSSDGKPTLLLFIEPPASSADEFPPTIKGEVTVDSRGKTRETLGAMQRTFDLVDGLVRKDVRLVTAFLSENAGTVKALMEKNQWNCEAVLVPGGLANPLVRQLGILSADLLPNVALVRPDGNIVWKLSGTIHPQVRAEGLGETLGVFAGSMKWNILREGLERAITTLEKGKNGEAIGMLAEPYPLPPKPRPDAWTPLRLHGLAKAKLKEGKLEEALADIDAAIQAHDVVFNRGKESSHQSVATLLRLKAEILGHSGKKEEAEAVRLKLESGVWTPSPEYYLKLHLKLEALGK